MKLRYFYSYLSGTHIYLTFSSQVPTSFKYGTMVFEDVKEYLW